MKTTSATVARLVDTPELMRLDDRARELGVVSIPDRAMSHLGGDGQHVLVTTGLQIGEILLTHLLVNVRLRDQVDIDRDDVRAFAALDRDFSLVFEIESVELLRDEQILVFDDGAHARAARLAGLEFAAALLPRRAA